LRQAVVLESSLAAIADLLDEHEEIIEAIAAIFGAASSGPILVARG
jgi:hypothetical protein